MLWSARRLKTFFVSVSAGAPRRIALLRFSGLPARAVPNSLISSVSRSRNGSPHRAEDEVLLDRLLRLLDRDVGVFHAGFGVTAALGDRIALRRAVDEVLGDQRLRLGPADGVLAEDGDRAGQLDLGDRALLGVDEQLADRAGRDAGDLDLGAVDEAEGVVQLDVVGASRRRRSRSPRASATEPASRARMRARRRISVARRDDRRVAVDGSALAGGVVGSMNGLEPSGAGRSFEPGQRL